MSYPEPGCDECGRLIAKAHRVYRGHRYCSTCYARVFKPAPCSNCGVSTRLPNNIASAMCRACESARPCIRCTRKGRPIGKLTPSGPVCNSCAPYFRSPERCEGCGASSNRLSRVRRLGDARRLCPKCARADHRTCPSCRRSRLLIRDADGREVCRRCCSGSEATCLQCGSITPAGRGALCEGCGWAKSVAIRLKAFADSFSSPHMVKRFEDFTSWLVATTGAQKTALKLERFLPLFLDIEQRWGDIPNYAELVAAFGVARLRRSLLALRWMEETGRIVVDEKVKRDGSDRQRIRTTLAMFDRSSHGFALLSGFHKVMIAEQQLQGTSMRTVRLSMTAAAGMLRRASGMKLMPPTQAVLDSYLTRTPGQRAAVTRFVRYLVEHKGVEMRIPPTNPARAHQLKRRRQERRVLRLMDKPLTDAVSTRRWLGAALSYFHGLDAAVARAVKLEQISRRDGGLLVEWQGDEYWVPIVGQAANSGP